VDKFCWQKVLLVASFVLAINSISICYRCNHICNMCNNLESPQGYRYRVSFIGLKVSVDNFSVFCKWSVDNFSIDNCSDDSCSVSGLWSVVNFSVDNCSDDSCSASGLLTTTTDNFSVVLQVV